MKTTRNKTITNETGRWVLDRVTSVGVIAVTRFNNLNFKTHYRQLSVFDARTKGINVPDRFWYASGITPQPIRLTLPVPAEEEAHEPAPVRRRRKGPPLPLPRGGTKIEVKS